MQKIIKALAQSNITPKEIKDQAKRAFAKERLSINTRLTRVKKRLDDYHLQRVIGKGAFGEVRLAKCKETGMKMVIQIRLWR